MEGSVPLAAVLWRLGGLLCHQLPDRSPQFEGSVFPLCFRCAGLYVSLLMGFISLAASGGYRRRLPDLRYAISISVLTVPLLVDGWANVLGLWSSAGWVRALTGVGVGLVLPLLLVPLAQPVGLGAAGVMKPTLSTPLALLPPTLISLVLLWLVVHPTRLWVFHALAVAASFAPAVFLFAFFMVGWRNRAGFLHALGVAPRDVPC